MHVALTYMYMYSMEFELQPGHRKVSITQRKKREVMDRCG